MSNERKACPLLSIGAREDVLIECINEDCAFWLPEENACAVVIIARYLRQIMYKENQKRN